MIIFILPVHHLQIIGTSMDHGTINADSVTTPQISGFNPFANLLPSAVLGNYVAQPGGYNSFSSLQATSDNFTVIGSGTIVFNLTQAGYGITLDSSHSLIFPTIDFGLENHATYVGINLILKDDIGLLYFVTLQDYYIGTYNNATRSLNLRTSISNPTNTNQWAIWGIEMSSILNYWGITSLTLDTLRITHGDSASFKGPRKVVYSEPLIGNQGLPTFPNAQSAIFRGYYPIPPETVIYPNQPDFSGYTQLVNASGNATAGNLVAISSPYGELSDILVQNATIQLTGNGEYHFNLTDYGHEMTLDATQKLIFPWIDYGLVADATYVGVQLILKDAFGTIYFILIQDYYVGTYANTSTGLTLRSSISNTTMQDRWGIYGVNMAEVLSIFSKENLVLTNIKFIIAASSSFNGPREVVFADPLIGTGSMPVFEGVSGNVFRGYYGLPYMPPVVPVTSQPTTPTNTPSTSTYTPTTTTSVSTEPANTFKGTPLPGNEESISDPSVASFPSIFMLPIPLIAIYYRKKVNQGSP